MAFNDLTAGGMTVKRVSRWLMLGALFASAIGGAQAQSMGSGREDDSSSSEMQAMQLNPPETVPNEAQYNFQWENTPFDQVIDDLAQAFGVKIYMGETIGTKLSAQIKTSNIEEALNLACRTAKVSWKRLRVSGGALTFEQAETIARAAKDLSGAQVTLEDPGARRAYSWTLRPIQDEKAGLEGEAMYFVGKARPMSYAPAPSASESTRKLAPQEMQRFLDYLTAMNAQQRETVRQFLEELEMNAPSTTLTDDTSEEIDET